MVGDQVMVQIIHSTLKIIECGNKIGLNCKNGASIWESFGVDFGNHGSDANLQTEVMNKKAPRKSSEGS
jgi:hypothetical protein